MRFTSFSGTFTNLPDGGSIIIGNNAYQANYQGGDGNDLTLTVVRSWHPSRNRPAFVACFCCHRLMKISLWLSVLLMLLGVSVTHAGSATWNLNPLSNEWNTATNWTPATVPDGPSDVATFAVSNETHLFLRESVELDQIVFEPGASSYTMTCNPRVDFDFTGAGIINNSGVSQTFVTRILENQTGTGT